MGILSPGAISSVTTAMYSEPPFLGSIFTVNVTPGRVRNSRCSPSFAARIRAVGLVTGVDCSTGAATAQQYTIEKTPIATRTDRINTSVLLPKGKGDASHMYAGGYPANLLLAMQSRKEE